MDKSKAITRLNNLEEKYKEFTSNQHKFITLKDCSKDHDYFETKLSEIIKESYLDVRSEFQAYLDSLDTLPVFPGSPGLQGDLPALDTQQ